MACGGALCGYTPSPPSTTCGHLTHPTPPLDTDAFRSLYPGGAIPCTGDILAPLQPLWAAAGLESSPPSPPTRAGGGGGGGGGGGHHPTLLAASLRCRSSLEAGFHLFTASGPLAGEPVWGCAFIIEEAILRRSNDDMAISPVSSVAGAGAGAGSALLLSQGALMASARDAYRCAFASGAPRLVEALFSCELHCSGGLGGGGEAMGKCYGVLSKRRGACAEGGSFVSQPRLCWITLFSLLRRACLE